MIAADRDNNAIRQILLATNTVTIIAGSTSGTSGSTDGTGTAARFNNPAGLAFLAETNTLFVVDVVNHVVRAINLTSAAVTTVAGVAGSAGTASGSATGVARLNMPVSLQAACMKNQSPQLGSGANC